MLSKKRKYVYVKISKDKYLKLRLMLRGSEEPSISASMEVGRDIVLLNTLVKKPSPSYTVLSIDDLPTNIKQEIQKQIFM